MKKIIYMALFALSCMMTVVSCTEEEVKPKVENGGGGNSDSKL